MYALSLSLYIYIYITHTISHTFPIKVAVPNKTLSCFTQNVQCEKWWLTLKTLSWFTNSKVYSLLYILSSRKGKIWKLSRPRQLDKEKQHVMRRERDQTLTLNYLSAFVLQLPRSPLFSGVRPFFQSSSQNGACNFCLFILSLASIELSFLPLRVSLPTFNLSRPFTSDWYLEGGIYSFPVVPNLRRRFKASCSFPSHF